MKSEKERTVADLPNDFWSGWIIVITVLSFFFLGWMIFSIYFAKDVRNPNQPGEDHAEPVWDDNLREGSNAPPLWWFWFILATMVFSVVYLILYPGLGNFVGMLRWSQDSRITASYETFEQRYQDSRQTVQQSDIASLQQSDAYMATAQQIFTERCAACHGETGMGQASMFPNLKDDTWQWGGSAEQIEQTIRNGRKAGMIAWQGILNAEQIGNVADHVLSMSGSSPGNDDGKTQFNQYCAACHGQTGEGNPMLGAPALNDAEWLYGGSKAAIHTSIADGRTGEMPAFKDRLDDVQIKLLVAYLTGGS
jgi:cytochrome c oxidase cbb3-type subunit 3